MNKVLVTGSGGFIGSHLTELLVKLGYEVRCMVTYNSFNSWGWLEHLDKSTKSFIDVHSGDIRDPDFCDNAVKGVDGIFHLAALIAIPYSFIAPSSYISTNINGTLNILQSARKHDVQKTICTSTSETYGTAKFVPITESHPLNAQSPYAASKVASDQLALAFYHAFSQPISILRPFNTYGPRQSARAIIPTIITQIAAGQKELRLGKLSPTRDFTYVTDTAQGFVNSMKASGNCGKIINLGSNFEISIENTAKVIIDEMGADINITLDNNRIRPNNSEVERLFADTTNATTEIEWAPEFGGLNGFRLGIKKTIEWYSNFDNLSKFKSSIYNT